MIDGLRGLRKKTEGPGAMVSAFQGEKRGFGLPLSQEELARVNSFRGAQGRKYLQMSPGLGLFIFWQEQGRFWGVR